MSNRHSVCIVIVTSEWALHNAHTKALLHLISHRTAVNCVVVEYHDARAFSHRCRNFSTSGLMLLLLLLISMPKVTTASTPDTFRKASPM